MENVINDQIAIYQKEDGYEVWCGDDDGNIINAHIIGSGPTRDAAVADAVKYLASALGWLVAPTGVVREVDVRGRLRSRIRGHVPV